MSKSEEFEPAEENRSMYREYILGVRIIECEVAAETGVHYRFEAPSHQGVRFEEADSAELYADVYFDVNGFEEAGTGERGVPPEIIQAGRDTLAAYFLTQPYTDINWIASFYGKKPTKIERYVAAVKTRAEEIRQGAEDLDVE